MSTHEVYRLLSFDTLRFYTHLQTRGYCDKKKTAHTRGRRADAGAAYFRVSVFPVKVDPARPGRLTDEIVKDINEWRQTMGKKPVTVHSRTKEPEMYHLHT